MQVVLSRVADGAVHLEGGSTREQRRVGGARLRQLDKGRSVWLSVGDAPRRPRDRRASELQGEHGVGQMVLHGLKAADLHAELLSLLRVGDSHVKGARSQPDELRRRAESAAI